MRRALFLMFLVAACGGNTPANTSPGPAMATSQSDPGAATPTLAIQTFMAAIKNQDLDALSVIWGSAKGPARDVGPADQLRKRELIMECYLQHDSFGVQSDVEQQKGLHVMSLQITKGSFTRTTKTQVVQGPNGRWFVDNIELEPLKDLCSGVQSH